MEIGEICIETNDVVKMANFYRYLFDIDSFSNDTVHQTIVDDDISLTIFNDGKPKNNKNQNITLAFTVTDMAREYQKLLKCGVKIIEPPIKRPWGAVNMSFYDPDGNKIYLRCFE